MGVQNSVDRLNAIKARIRTNLVAQGITVPEDTALEEMAEQILSVAGEDGYTPVKGKDYFTDAEKAAMVSEVEAAIQIGDYVPKSGTTMTGALVAQNNTAYTIKQVRNIILLQDGASVPATDNGDVILFYHTI